MKRSSWKREDGAKGQSFGGSLCQIKGVKDIIELPSAFNILGAYLFSEKKNGISFNPDFPCNSPIVYHKLRVLSRAFVPFGGKCRQNPPPQLPCLPRRERGRDRHSGRRGGTRSFFGGSLRLAEGNLHAFHTSHLIDLTLKDYNKTFIHRYRRRRGRDESGIRRNGASLDEKGLCIF